MNWRWSCLDRFNLVSNSDAHSPSRLGREANLLEIAPSFSTLREALLTGNGLQGTIEFFPEEGKYHLDGHRKCEIRLGPSETRRLHGLCPVCDRPVTIGVLHRVVELGDRESGFIPKDAKSFVRLLPLEEILAEILQCGPGARRVQRLQQQLLERWGPELRILRHVPISTIAEANISLLAEAIDRMRKGRILDQAGFDGQYGSISFFREEERAYLQGQRRLLSDPVTTPQRPQESKQPSSSDSPQRLLSIPKSDPYLGSDSSETPTLTKLNSMQKRAVTHGDSPLMIIAGPGTGKTLTLTHRIAHLLQEGRARPQEVLALTFTHRASQEMKRRLFDLLEGRPWIQQVRIQTLHAFGHQFLREHRRTFGWPTMPFLANEGVRMRILVEALREECSAINTRSLPSLMDKISLWKQMCVSETTSDSLIAQAANAYERKLRQMGALDFDDLLRHPLRLLEEREDIRSETHKAIRYVFVDEYQDLNTLQVSLLKKLYQPEGHLTVIGDPDQSIYGFRGANTDRFTSFQEDFPGAETLRLEQNYRSTRVIVNAAIEVISQNHLPYPRALLSSRKMGLPIFSRVFDSGKAEAIFIAKEISQLLGGTSHWAMHRGESHVSEKTGDISFGDVAILYRLHALSGPVEDALARDGIPYQRYGDRTLLNDEILEGLLAAIRFSLDPCRNDDLLRALSIQTIGLSEETIEGLRRGAEASPRTLWENLSEPGIMNGLDPKEASRVQRQVQFFKNILDESRHSAPREVVRHLIASLRIHIPESSSNWDPRAEILRQFVASAEGWEEDLGSFQDLWCLQEESDLYDPRSDRVTLLSVHACKGLEFPVVFISGCEDGIFPLTPRGKEDWDLEEERRLFFVALTRAKDLLYMTRARSRRIWGQQQRAEASRFLSDIPHTLLQEEEIHRPISKRQSTQQLKLF
jgi:superfamily I DNA/RNA helicase